MTQEKERRRDGEEEEGEKKRAQGRQMDAKVSLREDGNEKGGRTRS